ncbi:hypothetical protein AXE76_00110 [Gardnerella vaginalis]|uniref:DUF3043 domain-containing protein n=1 Tax=Gardnerella vaginalis TaxID=2702 RepID=A0A3E1IPM7_GARVA|nr:DUF3043 domain-containing protein [Gardnerella vaginalis]RFD74674.1 hypothetical protein AXE76_00110 [Gardnerella vaginalis]
MTWNPFAKKTAANEASVGASAQQKTDEKSDEKSAVKSREKNAPTPKRNAAQAQNLRPLVPADRKASAKQARARIRQRENIQYEAMRTGDLAHMPKVEQLPWRVYIRDYVDARFNIGEFFVPFAIVIMICLFALSRFVIVYIALAVLLYTYLFASVIDMFIMWRKLRKELVRRYGDVAVSKQSRSGMYAWSRAMQMRRWRLPKPSSPKRGNWPK